MTKTKTLSWGQCKIIVRKIGKKSAKWLLFPIPVEDSTQLEATKGAKKEAKIEGGENEAVRYDKNTYSLAANVRIAPEQPKPVVDHDGSVDGEYEVVVVPENPKAIAIKIDRSTISAGPSFNASEGIIQEYTWDALKPDSGDTVKYGIATLKETEGVIEDVEFEEIEIDEDDEGDDLE